MIDCLTDTEITGVEKYFDLSEGRERPLALWLIGRPAAGKTTIATLLHNALRERGHRVELVDGETVRSILAGAFGFTADDRLAVFNKYVHVSRILQSRGILPITATIGGFRKFRDIVRNNLQDPRIIYLDCPFEVAAARDQKGHYARALAGELKNFFDVDIPFELPRGYEMKIDSASLKPPEIVRRILEHFDQAGLLRKFLRKRPEYEVDKISVGS